LKEKIFLGAQFKKQLFEALDFSTEFNATERKAREAFLKRQNKLSIR
jgi:hypothetical protein